MSSNVKMYKSPIKMSPRKGLSELSPRRVPRSPNLPPKTPPQWKRPDEVMRLNKIKRRSLTSRFNSIEAPKAVFKSPDSNTIHKRKNPFKVNESTNSPKKVKSETEAVVDSSLFRLLGLADPQANHSDPLNFESIIEKIREQNCPKVKEDFTGRSVLPIDWSLRTKLRFLSTKQFPWNQTLRTCEEASGITGFVRCLPSGDNSTESNLDTSPNAMFHQCCLYWQHPYFPWIDLYPRKVGNKRSSETTDQLPSFASNKLARDAIHADFTESFNSVFQLLRARHCPYFYLVANSFSCLFRAAGINGSSEITAMISPTTQGFRQQLRDNEIEFSMPLRQKDKKRRSGEALNNGNNAEDDLDEIDEDDQGETRKWLASVGVNEKEINTLNSSQLNTSGSGESEIDGSNESLVHVEGSEVSMLFNFLINLRSISASTGPLAGIPPTILSPVAFKRATLNSLQVRQSMVKVESDSFYSMEIRGPILPHTLHSLCEILNNCQDEFTITSATEQQTKSFTSAASKPPVDDGPKPDNSDEAKIDSNAGSVFNIQNLSDSGMKPTIVSRFCSQDIHIFDSVKFSDQLYTIA